MYQVISPYTDLRKIPSNERTEGEFDRNLESQLILGEKVEVIQFDSEWCFVQALEQIIFDGTEWKPYPGWVLKKDLRPLHKEVKKNTRNPFHLREEIVPLAETFLNWPYLWGGRSYFDSEHPHHTSVDCSGYTNLLYRSFGIDIPRNAHDQYLFSKKISREDLKPGDLIFISKPNKKIYHVMLYAGKGELLEATAITGSVRRTKLNTRPEEDDCFYYGELNS